MTQEGGIPWDASAVEVDMALTSMEPGDSKVFKGDGIAIPDWTATKKSDGGFVLDDGGGRPIDTRDRAEALTWLVRVA